MERRLMVEECWLMSREAEQSRTGVLIGLVVGLVQPEFLVRRYLARKKNNSNNHRKEGHPGPRSLELVKTVRNLVIGAKRGNASSLMSGFVKSLMRGPVNDLVIDREKAIERISTTETGTAVEKERAGVTEEIETVAHGITIVTGVGKGTRRAASMKTMVEDLVREKRSTREEVTQTVMISTVTVPDMMIVSTSVLSRVSMDLMADAIVFP
ncbi:unnamed protein product [Brassica rapa]|uniref:Uncharacterized protein n=1 Tax=Brassica campestris TaxID=3711 RepID=A0A8D9HME8_BRACM|nr:unnamed protein product [Brassica rapa]